MKYIKYTIYKIIYSSELKNVGGIYFYNIKHKMLLTVYQQNNNLISYIIIFIKSDKSISVKIDFFKLSELCYLYMREGNVNTISFND